MTWANKSRESLALWRDEWFFERDTLVSRLYRCADADEAIAITHRRGDMRHLVAALLSLFGSSPELLKSFEEKRFHVMRL